MAKQIRCKACGKLVEEETKGIMSLTLGGFDAASYVGKKQWGYLHEACFLRSVDMPSLALEQIRKAGRAASKPSRS